MYGIYQITISSLGTISGTVTGYTSGSVLTLSNLRILSSGTFTLTVASPGLVSIASSLFAITNYVYTIAIVSSIPSPSVNFSFTITATLKGEDGNLFTGIETASLTSTSTVFGTTSGTNSGGTIVFTIYYSSSGAYTVTVTCASKSASLSLNVLPDTLKITAYTPV